MSGSWPRVLITGGTGVLGRKLVPRLIAKGATVRVGSRSTQEQGAPSFSEEVEWAQIGLARGASLAEALDGVDTVIHAASTPVASRKVDVGGTGHLLDAALQAGVSHLIYISIVGIDDFPLGYYRSKKNAEELVEAASLPHTILRATQFHELLDQRFLPVLFKLPFLALVPTDFQFQLVDSGEVADRMVELVAATPSGRVRDFGGPEVLQLGEIVSTWQRSHRVSKTVLPIHVPGAAAAAYRRGQNTCPDECHGRITWARYLAPGLPGTDG